MHSYSLFLPTAVNDAAIINFYIKQANRMRVVFNFFSARSGSITIFDLMPVMLQIHRNLSLERTSIFPKEQLENIKG